MSQPLTQHIWWLASRASGVVALGLVTVSVVLGLMMAGKLSRRPGAGRVLSAIHEQTALTGLAAIAVHGLTLLGDPWLNPGPTGIAIPFTMAYKTLWVGLGITAGWLAALLGLSFYARRRIGPRLWRRAHKATIVVYGLGVAHTLGAGTDAASPWLFWPVVATIPVVVTLFAARVVQGIRRGRARAASRREAVAGRGSELPPDVEIPPRHRRREVEEPAVA
jgi:methionine sulfoxide reductase heme-binding subunit